MGSKICWALLVLWTGWFGYSIIAGLTRGGSFFDRNGVAQSAQIIGVLIVLAIWFFPAAIVTVLGAYLHTREQKARHLSERDSHFPGPNSR
jgi:hypothetical protein